MPNLAELPSCISKLGCSDQLPAAAGSLGLLAVSRCLLAESRVCQFRRPAPGPVVLAPFLDLPVVAEYCPGQGGGVRAGGPGVVDFLPQVARCELPILATWAVHFTERSIPWVAVRRGKMYKMYRAKK